ncbi:Inositol-pentakisphosphate 2-kinase [Oleoguttula sp. CCFEE 5521]
MSITAYYEEEGDLQSIGVKPSTSSTLLKLTYLSEGGANFVFRIAATTPDGINPLRGKLLRLRKDLSHVQSAQAQLEAFDANFRPLFPPHHVVQQQLISLGPGLAKSLNAAIKMLNRPSHRLEDFLPLNELTGLLVTDMTPADDNESVLELKPKWLAQSPSAPANAKRCRTCALRAQRGAQRVHTATDRQKTCPLRLVSGDQDQRTEVATSSTDNAAIARFLTGDGQQLLMTLRNHQEALDPRGVHGAPDEAAIWNVCRAMTLRDCTLFVKSSEGKIEARLGDLDLKLPEKMAYWKEVESRLSADGWYGNAEAQGVWAEETVCVLSRP